MERVARHKIDSTAKQLRQLVGELLDVPPKTRRYGLVLDVMAEPAPNESWVAHRPGAEALPVFLVIRCKRAAREATDKVLG